MVQTDPHLGSFFAFFGPVGLQPLAQGAQDAEHQVDGDDDQDGDEKTPRHRAMVAARW